MAHYEALGRDAAADFAAKLQQKTEELSQTALELEGVRAQLTEYETTLSSLREEVSRVPVLEKSVAQLEGTVASLNTQASQVSFTLDLNILNHRIFINAKK